MKPTQPVKKSRWRVIPFEGGARDGEKLWVDVSKDQVFMGIVSEAKFMSQTKEVYNIEDESRAVYKTKRYYAMYGARKR